MDSTCLSSLNSGAYSPNEHSCTMVQLCNDVSRLGLVLSTYSRVVPNDFISDQTDRTLGNTIHIGYC